MTGEVVSRLSAGEIEELTSEGQREMAAARAMLRAVTLMNRAVEQSGLSQREIADALGVSEGRVSQVLTGDGNVRLSTLARYLRVSGYALQIGAEPAAAAVEPIRRRTPRRSRPTGDENAIYIATVEHEGRPGVKIVALSGGMPPGANETTPLEHVGWASPGSLTLSAQGRREVSSS